MRDKIHGTNFPRLLRVVQGRLGELLDGENDESLRLRVNK
jgi:hypothetical protein